MHAAQDPHRRTHRSGASCNIARWSATSMISALTTGSLLCRHAAYLVERAYLAGGVERAYLSCHHRPSILRLSPPRPRLLPACRDGGSGEKLGGLGHCDAPALCASGPHQRRAPPQSSGWEGSLRPDDRGAARHIHYRPARSLPRRTADCGRPTALLAALYAGEPAHSGGALLRRPPRGWPGQHRRLSAARAF